MDGRVVVITGATGGIGKAAAIALAQQGASVVLVARDMGRGEEVRAAVREATGKEAELLLADLGVQAEVRRLASELLERFPKIHVLLNNAGVVNLKREVTIDGLEATFAVNHLGPFLLTNLLLERLQESAPARIVNVSSDAHTFGALDLDDLQSERRYGVARVYGISKLCNILFTRELSRRLAGSGVTVNSLHPGAVATGLGGNNGPWAKRVLKLLRPFFLTPEKGADTAVYLASSPEVEGVTGEYFVKRKVRRPSNAALDDATAKKLWDASLKLTGLA
ncbi:oxidoreductase, short chain dehydrogenase/reductase family [Chondromyces apiculatus DSM 436]|uniref:Oxidoreductase, short chain dehydrogenase/reductase family n=2 Tax=Chondromyces apiculatus TaxID=51 RepID=A0A017T882_9BACT|nr:oxidoreductase, short chain dehydrogenase/reductase family [Chondromyces apiculatus DSM 436]